MPNHLLFQAYNEQQVAQCRYFFLKYLALYNLKPPPATGVILYTNEPMAFEGFTNFFPGFHMPELLLNAAPDTLTTATILHQTFLQYSGALLFCDSATYPLQPLEHLFTDIEKGALYLHSPHRYTESELSKAFHRFATTRDKTATTATVPAPARVNVWHTAVVGLNDQNKGLLAKLMDEPVAQSTLATDYGYTKVFSETGKIRSAAKYIFDYSALKEFGQLLDVFFKKNEEESIPNQVKAVHHIDAASVQQQKFQFQQQPLFKKWLHTITGKRWSIQQYLNKL